MTNPFTALLARRRRTAVARLHREHITIALANAGYPGFVTTWDPDRGQEVLSIGHPGTVLIRDWTTLALPLTEKLNLIRDRALYRTAQSAAGTTTSAG
jgi:hypothetical protein